MRQYLVTLYLRSNSMTSKRFSDAFERLAAAEQEFLECEFLAPALSRQKIGVRIDGVVCDLAIEPSDFEGWGIFRPTSHSTAQLVRVASLADRKRYLELFPQVILILCQRVESQWFAMSAHRGDSRFQIDGMVPIWHVEEGQQFEVVLARFDGSQFWFDGDDPRRDPGTAAYLRASLKEAVEPDEIQRQGLTLEQRMAYAVNYYRQQKAVEQEQADRIEDQLRKALQHAGADFVDYLERSDGFRVTFTINGQRHVSSVSKQDLSVQVAGICLSGRDRHFDLNSLVGVIREGQRAGALYHVGNDGLAEADYWRIHPPR